jgi:hypothetical protein
MELACHVRDPGQLGRPLNVADHLSSLYGDLSPGEKVWTEKVPERLDRLYVGDEFCSNRMPSLATLKAICERAEHERWGLTLLTPWLTDEGLDKCTQLLDYLGERAPQSEVVVNDWGALSFFSSRYPLFRYTLGRLLDKGFKDPRLLDAEGVASFSEEVEELLHRSTFDSVDFQRMVLEWGVSRLERDLLPYGGDEPKDSGLVATSFYFPFGYVTSGRVCWTASSSEPAPRRFALVRTCHSPCNSVTFMLSSNRFALSVFQSGNTVFYLYPASMCASLVQRAEQTSLRVIYQGLVL